MLLTMTMQPAKIEEEAAAELYKRLGAFIGRRIARPEDAEDITQEVFTRLLTPGRGPDDESRISAWLYVTARNTMVDFYRRQAREARLTLPDAADEGPPAEPDENTRQEIVACLRPMLRLLSEEDRRALTAVDLEGIPQKSWANTEGIPYATARSRVQRARQRLRASVEECCRITLDGRGRAVDWQKRDHPDCC